MEEMGEAGEDEEIEEDEPLEPPDDWEPVAIESLYGRDYAWREKPTYEEICRLASDALEDVFWQERNNACYDQSYCYYRSQVWTKLNGKAFKFIEGDLLYLLSTPTKQVDRIVARCQPHPENLSFRLDVRSELDEYQEAQQKVENYGRDLWEKLCRRWRREVSQTRLAASLERTVTLLATLHGAVAYSVRLDLQRKKAKKRDINAHNPVVIDVIPQHEVYMLGDCALRIQAVTLKEARRLSARVRELWPTKRKDELASGEWYPEEDTLCRLISFSDLYGKWYAQCFDLMIEDKQKARLRDGQDTQHWTIEPEEWNLGRCAFQLPPGWQSTGDNALPDERQPAENYGRQFARGVLFANLQDFALQDQAASAALTAFAYNRDPASVDKIDYRLRQESGQALPERAILAQGGRNERAITESMEFIPKHFADNPSDQFFLQMSFGQTADTFPAQLGGGGAASSGYDRRQMVENAQLLHVGEIRKYVAMFVEMVVQDTLEMLYRFGTGKKPVFKDLPFKQGTGKVGEARLGMRDLEMAGTDVRVEYYEEDIEAELRKNNIYLPRLQAGLLSKQKVRELLGEDQPDREEERIDEEFAVTHPTLQMARALRAMTRRRHPLLPYLREAAAMEKAGGTPPGPVGMPSVGGGDPGGLPVAARGMPPGMPMPPGL